MNESLTKRIASGVTYFLIVAVIIDLAIVVTAMMQITEATQTPHIGFWDAQIRFIYNLIRP